MSLYREQLDRGQYDCGWKQFSTGRRWAKVQMARRIRYKTKLAIRLGKSVLPEKKEYKGYET